MNLGPKHLSLLEFETWQLRQLNHYGQFLHSQHKWPDQPEWPQLQIHIAMTIPTIAHHTYLLTSFNEFVQTMLRVFAISGIC